MTKLPPRPPRAAAAMLFFLLLQIGSPGPWPWQRFGGGGVVIRLEHTLHVGIGKKKKKGYIFFLSFPFFLVKEIHSFSTTTIGHLESGGAFLGPKLAMAPSLWKLLKNCLNANITLRTSLASTATENSPNLATTWTPTAKSWLPQPPAAAPYIERRGAVCYKVHIERHTRVHIVLPDELEVSALATAERPSGHRSSGMESLLCIHVYFHRFFSMYSRIYVSPRVCQELEIRIPSKSHDATMFGKRSQIVLILPNFVEI